MSAGPSSLRDDLTAGFALGLAHSCRLSSTMRAEITLVHAYTVTVAFSFHALFSLTCLRFPFFKIELEVDCSRTECNASKPMNVGEVSMFGAQATVVHWHARKVEGRVSEAQV